jgi:hypothetical protein
MTTMRIALAALAVAVILCGVWLLGSHAGKTESSGSGQQECWVVVIAFQMETNALVDETTCTEPGHIEPDWECDFTQLSPVTCDLAVEFGTGAKAMCTIDPLNLAECEGIDGAGSQSCERLSDLFPNDVLCLGDVAYFCNVTSATDINCTTSLGSDILSCSWQSATNHFACDFVAPTPTPAPQQVDWGDVDCSGSPDAMDGLLILSYVGGLNPDTGDCPSLGDPVIAIIASGPLSWGDVDCSFEIDALDALWLIRAEAGLGYAVGNGCPDIGVPVNVSSITFP